MSKPIIILGAGASKDYIYRELNRKSLDWQPPLTNELFGRNVFDLFLDKYPHVRALAADAITKVPHRMTLETYLSNIKDNKAVNDINRQRQLAALGFYLQQLFQKVSKEYGFQHYNNYNSLIAKINDNGGEALVVNFNYDKLLEQNIPEIKTRVGEYVSGPIKVIKLHGSCDWVYVLPNNFNEERESYDYFMENPQFEEAGRLGLDERSLFRGDGFNSYKQNYEGYFWNFYPAVAIPIAKDNFICPDIHIQYLKNALASASKILVIGWSAGDPQLLELIKENVFKPVSVTIVSQNHNSAVAICKKMENFEFLRLTASKQEGFSNFMRSEEIDNFLES